MQKHNFVTASHDNTIRFWSLKSKITKLSIPYKQSNINDLKVEAKSNRLLAASNPKILIFNIGSNPQKSLNILSGHTNNVMSIFVEEEGNIVYSCSEDQSLRKWDFRTNKEVMKIETNSPLSDFVVLQGKIVTTVDYSGYIRFWDMNNNKQMKEIFTGRELLTSINFSESLDQFAVSSIKGSCFILSKSEGNDQIYNISSKFQPHSSICLRCVFSPISKKLATVSSDATAKVWEHDGHFKLYREFKEHKDWVSAAVFLDKDEKILTASFDGMVRLFDISTGKIKHVYNSHSKSITALSVF